MKKIYTVKYKGDFGFIKPWTAVRDDLTFSQQFLTQSIVEGIEKKLFPELLNKNGIKKIIRHKLFYHGIANSQETTRPLIENPFIEKGSVKGYRAVLTRGLLVNPVLLLCFKDKKDAEQAYTQNICLCRNEDILLPYEILELNEKEFNNYVEENYDIGYELKFSKNFTKNTFLVGYNRFDNKKMYGKLEYTKA